MRLVPFKAPPTSPILVVAAAPDVNLQTGISKEKTPPSPSPSTWLTSRKQQWDQSRGIHRTTPSHTQIPLPVTQKRASKKKRNKFILTSLYHRIAAANSRLAPVFGSAGFAFFDWKTSVLGTLIGLICAQNTTNSFSAVMYNNLITLEPNATGLEPDWERLRQRSPHYLQNALSCGPFYRLKSRMIIKLLNTVHEQFGTTSLDALEDRNVWPDERVRTRLMSYSGIGVKTTSCMLLYRLCRLSFAVDTNILKIGARIGWFTGMGVTPSEALPAERKDKETLSSKRQRQTNAAVSVSSSSSCSSSSLPLSLPLSLPSSSSSTTTSTTNTSSSLLSSSIIPSSITPSTSSSSSSSSSSPIILLDVEDIVPIVKRKKSTSLATSRPLKRHAKAAQQYINQCLETEDFSMDKWSILYNAHVRLIAMGEVFCHTRRPLCGGCPLNTICKFAAKHTEYMSPPPVGSMPPALSCTLAVHVVTGTVAVTLGGVRRPVSLFSAPTSSSSSSSSSSSTSSSSSSSTYSNYVQCVLHITASFDDYAEGRLFISPWLAFNGSFPMRGSYFIQNELFEVEGICRAPWSSLRSSSSSLRPINLSNVSNDDITESNQTNYPIETSKETFKECETSVIHLSRSIPVIFRSRPTSEISRIFRSGFVCCRRFRFPRQLRSYGKHFTGTSTDRLPQGRADDDNAESMAKRDIEEAVYRIVHILENKQREEDWKSGKIRRPPSQRRSLSKKSNKSNRSKTSKKTSSSSSSSSSSNKSFTKKSQASALHNNVLAIVSDIQTLRIQAAASPIVVQQKAIEVVQRVQTRRFLIQWCDIFLTELISKIVDGCRGALICTCGSLDTLDETMVRCDQCMRQHHLRCTGLDSEDCDCLLNMPKLNASFVCGACTTHGIPTVADIRTMMDDPVAVEILTTKEENNENDEDRVLSTVAWWMAKAHRMNLKRWKDGRTSRLYACVAKCVRAGQELNLHLLRITVSEHLRIIQKHEKYIRRIHYLIDSLGTDLSDIYGMSETKMTEMIGKYAVSTFLHELGEAQLLAAEEGKHEAVRIHRMEKRKRKEKKKKNKVEDEEELGLVLMIDENVIREMYPSLVLSHCAHKTMVEIHHALEMSEWDEERANACLNRRGTLRGKDEKEDEEVSVLSSLRSSSSSSSSSSSNSCNDTNDTPNADVRVEKKTTVNTEWKCRDCTFMNVTTNVKCSLCDCPSTMLPPPLKFVLSYLRHTIDDEKEEQNTKKTKKIKQRTKTVKPNINKQIKSKTTPKTIVLLPKIKRSSKRRTPADQGFYCSICKTTGNLLYISKEFTNDDAANPLLFCMHCCMHSSNKGDEFTPITSIDFKRVINDAGVVVVDNDTETETNTNTNGEKKKITTKSMQSIQTTGKRKKKDTQKNTLPEKRRSSKRRTPADQGFYCSICKTTGNLLYISKEFTNDDAANPKLFCMDCSNSSNKGNAFTPITPIDFQRVTNAAGIVIVNDDKEMEQQTATHTTEIRTIRKIKTNKTIKKNGKRKYARKEESQCFACKDGGSLMKCDFLGCRKVFHHVCAGVIDGELMKKKLFYCPRHYCVECGARGKQWVKATVECYLCPVASKCQDHERWAPLLKIELPGVKHARMVCNKCSQYFL